MPEGTEVTSIQRWESRQLYFPYDSHKGQVRTELGPSWGKEDVESWLFYGTDRIEEHHMDGATMAYEWKLKKRVHVRVP